MAAIHPFSTQFDKLTTFDAGPHPVISLYLNLRPDQHGRDRFAPFVRGALKERLATYSEEGPERTSLDQDAQKIGATLDNIDASLNGLAIFACSGAGLFEVIPLAAAPLTHRLTIASQPHLYPLARLMDDFPVYAAVLLDSHSARIVLIAANMILREDDVAGVKTKRHKMGGWSQARFQRHVDNFRSQHAKEVADRLSRIVRDEQVPRVIVSGDEVITAMLRDELPKDVTARVIDVLSLDVRSPDHAILQSTLAAIQQHDARTDRERVDELLDAYRSGGLAAVGVENVLRAFELGQVDELLIAGTAANDTASQTSGDLSAEEQSADTLLVKARQTSASICFIQDAELLKPIGGAGAFLRFLVD